MKQLFLVLLPCFIGLPCAALTFQAKDKPAHIKAYSSTDRSATRKAQALEYSEAASIMQSYIKAWEGKPEAVTQVHQARKIKSHFESMQKIWDAARKNPTKHMAALAKKILSKPVYPFPSSSKEEIEACFALAAKNSELIQKKLAAFFPASIDAAGLGAAETCNFMSLKTALAQEGEALSLAFTGGGDHDVSTFKLRISMHDEGSLASFGQPNLRTSKLDCQVRVVDKAGKDLLHFSTQAKTFGTTAQHAALNAEKKLAKRIVFQLIKHLLGEAFPS